MKKVYEIPELNVIAISIADIITSSPVGGGGGDDIITPEDEF